MHGYGVELYTNGDGYQGYFENGEKHGEGIYYYAVGGTYTGHFLNGRK